MASVDYFARDFGDGDNVSGEVAPKMDYFTRDFEDEPKKKKKESVDSGLSYSDIPVPQNISQQTYKEYGAGLSRGGRNVGEGIGKLELALGNKLGLIGDENYGDTRQIMANRLNNYNDQYGGNKLSELGVVGGEIAASLPLFMAGGELAGAGSAALSRAAPAVESLGNYIKGNKLLNLTSKGVKGAELGVAGSLLTSGGSNESLGDRAKTGAEIGGLLGVGAPLIAGTGKYLWNAGKSIAAPFTERGQTALANKTIQNFAGEVPIINASEIVPGSVPTLAEATGNAGIAGLQRTMRDMPGGAINPFVEREQANALARNNLLLKAAGTPQDIEAAQAVRSAETNRTLDGIFTNTKEADPTEVLGTIDNILQGPGGKRDAVVSTLNNIRSKIIDSSGKLEKDPETLYRSVRKQIGDLLDKKDLTNSAGRQAASELLEVQESLDSAIEKGAPGFKKYLEDYTSASAPINSMGWMQGLNLTDSQGNITLSKVQNALKNVNKLKNAPGVHDAKSLTETQVGALKSIRDDLLRQTNTALGKSAGSNTVQNIASQNLLQSVLPGKAGAFASKIKPEVAGGALGTGIGSMVGSPTLGGVLGAGGGRVFSEVMQAKNAAIQNKLRDILLNPESFMPSANGNNVGMFSALGNSPIGQLVRDNYIPANIIATNRLMNDRRKVPAR